MIDFQRSVLMDGEPENQGTGGMTPEQITKLVQDTVNSTVNGFAKNFKEKDLPALLTPLQTQLQGISEALKPKEPEPKGPEGNPDNIKDPEIKALMLKMKKENEQLIKRLDDSEKASKEHAEKAKNTSLDSAVRQALSKFSFASEDAANDAFQIIRSQASFEDGTDKILAGELPLADFVADVIPNKKAYLLAPATKGGAGASTGVAGGKAGAFSIDSIKPGMSLDEQKAAAAAIKQAAGA